MMQPLSLKSTLVEESVSWKVPVVREIAQKIWSFIRKWQEKGWKRKELVWSGSVQAIKILSILVFHSLAFWKCKNSLTVLYCLCWEALCSAQNCPPYPLFLVGHIKCSSSNLWLDKQMTFLLSRSLTNEEKRLQLKLGIIYTSESFPNFRSEIKCSS